MGDGPLASHWRDDLALERRISRVGVGQAKSPDPIHFFLQAHGIRRSAASIGVNP